ncbi:MAG TPA: hypothetical protein VIJ39_13795 [Solirubrobacteraceae bacterium]
MEKFVAANCIESHPECGEEPGTTFPTEPSLTEAKEAGYTQAAGHPPYGITAFKVNTEGVFPNAVPAGLLTVGPVAHIRTDVAPGVSTNPEAVAKCSMEEFGAAEAIPGTGFYAESKCKTESEIGENKVVVYIGSKPSPEGGDLPITGKAYNLVQPAGRASDFGVALPLPIPLTAEIISGTPLKGTPAETAQYYAHTLIEGGVEWASDYHDYYEINVSTAIPLISSRLALKGNILLPGKENGGFITNPSNCAGPGPFTTNTVTLKSEAGQEAARSYTAPIGTENCLVTGPGAVPFAPTFALAPENKQSDQPTGVIAELALPHSASPAELDSSQLKNASITLPEGMTLSPSAAHGLEACTPAQARIHSTTPGMACPAASTLGSDTLTVPQLEGSLEGSVYLGGPESGPITGPPYTVYVDAESARYGISVRLEGKVIPNEATGRVTATFVNNPEQPFSKLVLHFKSGALAPIANPLTCGTATTQASFAPYTMNPATISPAIAPFVVDSNNAGGACASPLPFTLSQSTSATPTTGGSATNFNLNLGRADGQQYLSKVSAILPAGLVGKIPAVPLCPEPQASLGTCASTSQIGTAVTTVGSGPTPVQFSGPVYLTGPTGGAPYGMTTVINAAIGPFSLGNVIVRSKIEVNPITARITVSSEVPTIHAGIPLRLKTLTVAINRQGFLVNPTNCGALTTNTTLGSSFGATQSLTTPFQATGCSSLAFKPTFTSSSNAKTSRANGAALFVKVGYPSGTQANIKSVLVTVPKQLPSRNSTLKNACPEATFNANPYACPSNSKVGGATVTTPVLPQKVTGPAYFVSHGGAAFPDLDLVLKGSGVEVILVGNTNIKNGITTSNFASLPDVPVTGFELNLPTGKNSALGAVTNLCKQSLVMPTTITAQNGKVIKQNTKISVSGCPVTLVSRAARGSKAIVTVRVPAAGRVSGGGPGLKTIYKHPGKSQNVTLEVPLSTGSRPFSARVRVGFIPKAKGQKSSSVSTTVVFK